MVLQQMPFEQQIAGKKISYFHNIRSFPIICSFFGKRFYQTSLLHKYLFVSYFSLELCVLSKRGLSGVTVELDIFDQFFFFLILGTDCWLKV
jgi:hypothetical protein